MATVQTVKRIANPRRANKKRPPKHKAKRNTHTARPKVAARPRSSNPALLVTLGASNPRRHNKVKHPKRKAHRNPAKSRASSAKRNPTRVYVTAPRRKTNPTRALTAPRSSRNPDIFGMRMQPMTVGKAIMGSLIGVAGTKIIPSSLPSTIVTSQPIAILVSGAVAFGLGFGARKLDPAFGDGVLYGGLMQVVSLALNTYVEPIGSRIALRGGRGVGTIVSDVQFNFPENPIRRALTAPPPPPAAAAVAAAGSMGSVRRAFPSPW